MSVSLMLATPKRGSRTPDMHNRWYLDTTRLIHTYGPSQILGHFTVPLKTRSQGEAFSPIHQASSLHYATMYAQLARHYCLIAGL